MTTPAPRQLPAGEWSGADPRYRGYRPDKAGVRLDHRVRQAVDLVPRGGSRLVDLGAGDGFVTARLAAATGAGLAVAVDVGAPVPLAARDRPVARVAARLPGPLPFRSGSVDVVVTLETIEHVLDPDGLLEEIHRVLVPGGTLVLSTPRLDSFLVVGSLLLGVQPPGVECSSRRRYGSPFGEQRASGHVHLFTRRALTEALAANGFRLEAYREGRFSSSWWQAVRSDRRPRPLDLALRAVFAVYDLVPFRKDVMVVRATRTGTG
ncbi:MAG TPA: class I SAM-dependent methyltransferase [Acidimicrobiales bacterium]|nr:class I SAM-dependent methyltransferase [Acidimicrobiales bacterium]